MEKAVMEGSIWFPWYTEREYIEYVIKTLKNANVMLMALRLTDFLSLVCGRHAPRASSFSTVFRENALGLILKVQHQP